jgi:hypothetical protein
MVTKMAMPDRARRLSLCPSRPAVQKSRDAALAGTKNHRTAAKLDKATARATKRAARAADATATPAISSKELREREKTLREWLSRCAEPDARNVLKEHEFEAFYANTRAFFVDHNLSFNDCNALRQTFTAAVRASRPAPSSSDSDYWKGRGNSSASIIIGARLDGW